MNESNKDPLLTTPQAIKVLAEAGIKVHPKSLKAYAQAGDIRGQRDLRPGRRNVMKAPWLFRRSHLLEDFASFRVHNRENAYHDAMANGGYCDARR